MLHKPNKRETFIFKSRTAARGESWIFCRSFFFLYIFFLKNDEILLFFLEVSV